MVWWRYVRGRGGIEHVRLEDSAAGTVELTNPIYRDGHHDDEPVFTLQDTVSHKDVFQIAMQNSNVYSIQNKHDNRIVCTCILLAPTVLIVCLCFNHHEVCQEIFFKIFQSLIQLFVPEMFCHC